VPQSCYNSFIVTSKELENDQRANRSPHNRRHTGSTNGLVLWLCNVICKELKMKKEEVISMFDYWFEWRGHWMWGVTPEGKARAIECWKKYGIDGLPDYPV
jgi:hypothetical protein